MSLLLESLAHSWEPFVLVVGLLFIGHSAAHEGLFESVGQLCARVPGGDLSLFVVTMLAVALVTATLNLDTAVVFMTPVALEAARTRGVDERAFLYGTILMVNAASLLLLGSNLTNMLVFASQPARGSVVASHMALPWVVSVVLSIALVALAYRSTFRPRSSRASTDPISWSVGPGLVSTVLAVVAMLLLSHPALPILALGCSLEAYELVARRRVRWGEVVRVASPVVVVPLFLLAVAVGWLSREWSAPTQWLAHSGPMATAFAAALTSLLINNLPAASLFAAGHVTHPYALLIGLDLGPNAFVTGAMSTMLWLRIARANGARPTIARFSAIGIPVAVITILAATLVS